MSIPRRNHRQRGLDVVRKATASVAVAGLLGTGVFTVLEANRPKKTSATTVTQTTGTSGATTNQLTGDQSNGDQSSVVTNPSFGGDDGGAGSFTQPVSPPSNAGNQGGMVVSGGS